MTATFAELLQTLPNADHLEALELTAKHTDAVARLENKPGSAGSVRVYAALAAEFGCINAQAAARGLALYGEHTADARQHPGKHPNIDRLLELVGTEQQWQVRYIPANT